MDAHEWAKDPVSLRMASDIDGAYTAVVPAEDVDLTGWALVALSDDGAVRDEGRFASCPSWASYTLGPIAPAWEASAEFRVDGAWVYGLKSPDGEVFRIDDNN